MTILGVIPCTAQREPYCVIFEDKGPLPFAPGTTTYDTTLASFSPVALERRRRRGMSPLLDSADQPVHDGYRQRLADLGLAVGPTLRWLNAALVEMDIVEAGAVAALPFVRSAVPVRSQTLPATTVVTDTLPSCLPMRYGESSDHLRLMDVMPVHDAGVYGSGVIVGLIDNGFRWRSMSSLASAHIAGEYDVVDGDASTAYRVGEPPDQDHHGSLIMSLIAGFAPDTLIGMAPAATYLLAKTEDMRWERRIEDVHYAVAVEWLERNGADVISSSLGYRFFDDDQSSIPYAKLNGRTSFSARAVNRATALGVMCVTAAGNTGPYPRSLMTPADADSVLTVGATRLDGSRTTFTSYGPTADGRQKPEVVAPGEQILGANLATMGYTRVDGTSVATPLVAGALALLRNIYPNASGSELRQALITSTGTQGAPDSALGYGIPKVAAAADLLGPGPVRPAVIQEGDNRYVVATVFNTTPVSCKLVVTQNDGTFETREPISVNHPQYIFFLDEVHSAIPLSIAVFAVDAERRRKRTYPADTLMTVAPGILAVPCGMRLGIPATVEQDQPTTPAFRLAPSVVAPGRHSTITVLDTRERPASVVVSDGTGRINERPWTWNGDRLTIDVHGLAPGMWYVRCVGRTSVVLRFLVLPS